MAKKSTRSRRPEKKHTDLPKFMLENVAMVDCVCTREGIKAIPEMPGVVAIKLSYSATRTPDDASRLLCKIPIEATAAYSEEEPPALVLRATFAASLRFPSPLPENVGDERVRNYIRDMTIFQVWPYWRQFVQSTTVRMSLPPMQMFPEIPQEMLNNFVTTP